MNKTKPKYDPKEDTVDLIALAKEYVHSLKFYCI